MAANGWMVLNEAHIDIAATSIHISFHACRMRAVGSGGGGERGRRMKVACEHEGGGTTGRAKEKGAKGNRNDE